MAAQSKGLGQKKGDEKGGRRGSRTHFKLEDKNKL